MELDDKKGIVVLTGNSHPELAKQIVQSVSHRTTLVVPLESFA